MEYRKLPKNLASNGPYGGSPKGPGPGPGPMEFTEEMKARMARDEMLKQQRRPLAEKCLTGEASFSGVTLPYRLYVPEEMEAGKNYPLVLFLHGGGERGDDNMAQMLANDGACVWIRQQLEGAGEKCFVLAPQCPKDGYWMEKHLLAVKEALEQVVTKYPVDESRVYLTGMSMGGGGCWRMNYMFPETFAAMVPICSAAGVLENREIDQTAADQAAEAFVGKPLWIFHAADDVVVPVGTSRALVRALEKRGKKRGKDFFYTEYPAECGYNHGSWEPAYEWKLMRQWLFLQTTKQMEFGPGPSPGGPDMPPPEVIREMMEKEAAAKKARRAYLDIFEAREKKTPDLTLPYRLYVPEGKTEGLPLVVVLHGIGGCGCDNEMQILDNDGVIDWYRAQQNGLLPNCVILAPQCIEPIPNLRWELEYLEVVDRIVDDLVEELHLDTSRLYITGLSLGGYGSWNLNWLRPEKYAAVVSCCPACLGGTLMNNYIDADSIDRCAQALAGKPLWMFHSEDDMAVPISITKTMAQKLDGAGSGYHLTIYPAEKHYNHGCWEPAYKTEEMFAWLMEQRL